MVISTSLQACGVGFPFAIPTSICRSNVTICSALYLLIAISSRPPREFSLTSAGTKRPGQVTLPCLREIRDGGPFQERTSAQLTCVSSHGLQQASFQSCFP